MPDTIVQTLVDGVRIVVPDSLDLITPYVLREQQDFFEDELPFVRQLLQPGQDVIDIGANYGVAYGAVPGARGRCERVRARDAGAEGGLVRAGQRATRSARPLVAEIDRP
jgi:hypothetical protein